MYISQCKETLCHYELDRNCVQCSPVPPEATGLRFETFDELERVLNPKDF